MKNNKATDSIMFAMIERWQQSKQTISAFCKTENIAPHVFYYWHTKYKKQNNTAGGFIKITSSEISCKPLNYCELYFTNGMRLIFNEAPRADFIRQLL